MKSNSYSPSHINQLLVALYHSAIAPVCSTVRKRGAGRHGPYRVCIGLVGLDGTLKV